MRNNQSLLILFLISSTSLLCAQDNASEWDYIFVREDIVKPFMTVQYEAAIADLKIIFTEEVVSDYSHYTHLQDNYHFIHMTPLNKLEDVEKGTVEYLAKQVDKDKFNLIWSDLAATIQSSRNYILQYRADLSYVPKEIYWGKNEPYRRWNYYNFTPGSEKEVEGLIQAWKSLYEKKNIKSGFRIFSGVIGIENPLYIFTTWAEDPYDYQENLVNTIEMLGDEGAALWDETMRYVRDVETIEGWFLPQYSYISR
jgi:hypothetical protein